METLADIRKKVIGLVRDESNKIQDPEDFDRNINAALNRFSKHKPDTKVEDIVGNGTNDYDLPAGWVDEFSNIKSIELPIGDVPETLLDADTYSLYETPTGFKIRLLDDKPPATQSFRINHTIPRTIATIPPVDVDAFVMLAAGFCCEELSNAYAPTGDSTIGADSVDHKSKSHDYGIRAKRLMKLYREHLNLKDDDTLPAASAIVDMDSAGPNRMTHK